jgi:hypothetical protein
MTKLSVKALVGVVGITGLLGSSSACRKLFQQVKPSVERVNPNIPGGRLRILSPIAGGDALTDLQISVTVRQQLQDSGITVVRRNGRWDSQSDAVRIICEPGEVPSIDAVLFVWYNRLELRECGTGATAYEITSGGKEGITVMTARLIRYLRQTAASPS